MSYDVDTDVLIIPTGQIASAPKAMTTGVWRELMNDYYDPSGTLYPSVYTPFTDPSGVTDVWVDKQNVKHGILQPMIQWRLVELIPIMFLHVTL